MKLHNFDFLSQFIPRFLHWLSPYRCLGLITTPKAILGGISRSKIMKNPNPFNVDGPLWPEPRLNGSENRLQWTKPRPPKSPPPKNTRCLKTQMAQYRPDKAGGMFLYTVTTRGRASFSFKMSLRNFFAPFISLSHLYLPITRFGIEAPLFGNVGL